MIKMQNYQVMNMKKLLIISKKNFFNQKKVNVFYKIIKKKKNQL